jgi:hypothetical protein
MSSFTYLKMGGQGTSITAELRDSDHVYVGVNDSGSKAAIELSPLEAIILAQTIIQFFPHLMESVQ